ncbi:MAG: alginate export family protein [Gammaproteobacteria bacterium]|nr:alginate export family protein [Gammaproteobacteria bacterium]MDH4315897.1 alginate export family protein [Gammaproteobacteria bacterium]MDH5215805.1 alginate export family protein [Gammaproteobacteria bacterium]MDH5501577.1 alginate export family protein [Gammaproteobacteria bacterium]
MKVKTVPVMCVLALTGALAAAAAGAQEEEKGLADALTSGKAQLNLRYRFEHVDQENFADDANASTLRFRLNYATGNWRHWSGFAEFDYIGEVFIDDFNSGAGTSPERVQYPVVADPEGADLNQLYFDYAASEAIRLRLGRQRILLDNHRFVGNVGWRQNEQTYDAVNLNLKNLPNTELSYSYVSQVNRIFGERSPSGKDDQNTHLLNAKISLPDGWSLFPYVYYIDSDDTPAFSTATFGARLAGKIPAGEGSIALVAEYATQSDAANGPVDFRANYAHFDAAWAMKNGLSFGIGYESLGGDENVAGASFRTPLATLHAFQGWADQFLSTPDAGVEDLYGTIMYSYAKWNMQLTYHDLSAQAGSADWGKEFDLSFGRKLSDRYGVLLKGAFFDADSTSFVDVNKYWIMLTADF